MPVRGASGGRSKGNCCSELAGLSPGGEDVPIRCCDHDLAKQQCQEIRAEELQELPAVGRLAGRGGSVAVGWASPAQPADWAGEVLRLHFLPPPPSLSLSSLSLSPSLPHSLPLSCARHIMLQIPFEILLR